MNKQNLLFTIFLFFIILANVSALGVTPARNTLDFNANSRNTYTFKIINSENKDIDLKITTRGDLGQYIDLAERKIHMNSDENEKEISYVLNLPSDLKPGLEIGEIVVTEDASVGEGENYIGATLAVVTQVYVYVPYPGKYAEAKLNVLNADSNDEVTLVVSVASKGEFDLPNVYAIVDIFTSLNEKIDTFTTETYSIKSGEKKDIIYKWNSKDAKVGKYQTKVALVYDDKVINLEDTFSIGEANIELQDLYVNDFTLGQIVKVNMLLENKWSEAIIGVHSIMDIYGKSGNKLDSIKSPDYDIEPFGKQILSSYWDTAGVNEGNYDTKITLEYGTKKIDNDLELTVTTNEIKVYGLGYVISNDNRGDSTESDSLVTILVIVAVILILVNILWFLVLRKYIKK